MPVEELKIDKSLALGKQTDADDTPKVRSTIDLAHNLGLSMAAEGVENAAVLAPLRSLAIDEAQGYHVIRTQPVGAFGAWHALTACVPRPAGLGAPIYG